MLNHQLIQKNFPSIHLNDKIDFALQIMDDYEVQHLPVVDGSIFVGLVAKVDLIDVNETYKIETLQNQFIQKSVQSEAFFTESLAQISENELSIIAVVDEQKHLLGIISSTKIIEALNTFLDTNEKGAVIVLEVDKRHFSFGEICRLIETNNAYITQLNTSFNKDTGLTTVCIKLNTIDISDILATLQRYDYNVVYYFGEEAYANEVKENYSHLMAYLNI